MKLVLKELRAWGTWSWVSRVFHKKQSSFLWSPLSVAVGEETNYQKSDFYFKKIDWVQHRVLVLGFYKGKFAKNEPNKAIFKIFLKLAEKWYSFETIVLSINFEDSWRQKTGLSFWIQASEVKMGEYQANCRALHTRFSASEASVLGKLTRGGIFQF